MPLKPFAATRIEAVLDAAVGKLGDDEQPAIDYFDSLQRQQERMPHAANVVQGPQFVGGPFFVLLAKDELDRLGESAGRFGAPHFAVPTGADVLDQPVARQRLKIDVDVGCSRR